MTVELSNEDLKVIEQALLVLAQVRYQMQPSLGSIETRWPDIAKSLKIVQYSFKRVTK